MAGLLGYNRLTAKLAPTSSCRLAQIRCSLPDIMETVAASLLRPTADPTGPAALCRLGRLRTPLVTNGKLGRGLGS